jgi:hypothetical protein
MKNLIEGFIIGIVLSSIFISFTAQSSIDCLSLYKVNPTQWESKANIYLNTTYPDFVDLILEINDEELSKEISLVAAELCVYHGNHGETLEQVLERTVRGITPRAQAFLDYGPALLDSGGL